MVAWKRGGAIALLLALPLAARGHGFGLHSYGTVISYYPVPVAYVPVVTLAPAPAPVWVVPAPAASPAFVCPTPAAPPPIVSCPAPPALPAVPGMPSTQPAAPSYAAPTAAPPSAGPAAPATAPAASAPPLAEPQPLPPSPPAGRRSGTSESHSYYDVYQLARRGSTPPGGDRCTVSFWNLTGHDLVLTVDGQLRTLPAGKDVPLEVGRKFVWKVEGHDPQLAQVAAGEPGLEIVIRR